MRKEIRLVRMSAEDSAAFIPTIIRVFANHLVETKRLPDLNEASTFSSTLILTHFFRNSKMNENQHLFYIQDASSGTRVGHIWLTKKPSDQTGEDLRIGDISVAEDQRRKGYATAAIAKAEEFAIAMGYKTLSLNVFTDSIGAKELYEKLGFVVMGETKNTHGETAQYEMSKTLEPHLSHDRISRL